MSFLKKLISDTALYGMSTIVGRLLNWLMVAFHTRAFDEPEMLAENGLFYTFMVPLNIIYTFGMETAFFRYASKKENQNEYFNLILSFLLVLGASFSFLIIAFATPLSELLNMPHTEHLITMFSMILFIDTICAIAFVKLRANNQAKKFVAIKLSNIAINICLTLFFIYFCHGVVSHKINAGEQTYQWISSFYSKEKGPDFIIYANYVASLLTLLMLWKEFIGFRLTWNWAKLKTVVNYAWPLMIMGLAGAINLTADRLLFRAFLPNGFYPQFPNVDTAFGIYTNVYKLSIFMTLVVQAYRYAAEPLFFSKMQDKNSPQMIALSTKWFTIACIFIWLAVSTNLNWIGFILGENYRQGLFVVPFLLLANLFIGVYSNISIWFKLSDNTSVGSYITIIAMAITVVMNIILIPIFGFLGCAYAFVVSSFFMVAMCYFLGQKRFPIPYETGRILIYLALAGTLIAIHKNYLESLSLNLAIVSQIGLAFVFILFVYIFEKRKPSALKEI